MIDYAIITNKGEKENNEDTVKVFLNQQLLSYGFVLADGLGGHGHGDVASQFVVDCVGAAIESTDSMDGNFIADCFETAQNLLMQEKEKTGFLSIKTTMVMLTINGNIASWGHIGDSRLYHFRDNKMISRTIDHSVPQMLALTKKIKEKDIRHHPERSILLSAMGAEWDDKPYEVDNKGIKVAKGDTFLLCSDGFWEWIEEKTMMKILRSHTSAYDALNDMARELYIAGKGTGMDNYSAALIIIK